MRILVVHSRYLSGPASGENRVVEDEVSLLREAGHEVDAWTPEPGDVRGLGLARTAAGAIWSTAAVREVRARAARVRAQIVHCHNLFPTMSPAILRAASAEGAAVVMTLHNYRLACLPATFLRDGAPCTDCLGKLPWRGVVHRCYRGSVAGSASLAASLGVHRALRSFRVPRYLAVSAFVRDRHVEAGIDPARISVKPNFAWAGPVREGPGSYMLFLGRLSGEKGLDVVLRAWRPSFGRLVVAGDGPDAPALRSLAHEGVEFRGRVEPAEAAALLAGARALILPSIWFEGAPRSILEAYAAGVPVVASRIGGLPELVEDGVTGSLVEPGAPEAWADALAALADDAAVEKLGVEAHARWAERYSPAQGLRGLEDAYRAALLERGR